MNIETTPPTLRRTSRGSAVRFSGIAQGSATIFQPRDASFGATRYAATAITETETEIAAAGR